MTPRRADLLALLTLALAAALLVPQTVLLGKLPDHFDYWLQEYVHLAVLHRWLVSGELPLWNGQLVSGTPHLADPQTATLYPLTTVPLLLLSPALVARLSIPAHFFLAGAFTFGYARALGLSRVGALAAGLAYSLAPHFAPLEVATYLQQSAIWLPAILWAIRRGMTERRLWPFAIAGALWAVQLTRGYAQTWYVTGLYAAVYVLVELTVQASRRRAPAGVTPARLTPFAPLAGPLLFATVGLGLGAAQLLPSLELLADSQRGAGFSLAEASGPGRISLANLLGVAGPSAEVSGAFPGGVVLGLALAGVLYARGRHTAVALGTAGVSLALCLGDRTPLWGLLYGLVPGFTTLHMPHRTLFLWSLALALLAGAGLDALRRRPPLRPYAVVAACLGAGAWLAATTLPEMAAEAGAGAARLALGLAVVGAGAGLLRWPAGANGRRTTVTAIALAVTAGLDLLAYSLPRLYGHFYPPAAVYASPPAAGWLQARAAEAAQAGGGPFRFASAVYQTSDAGEGSKLQDNRRLAYLPPNTAALFPGLDGAQGYLAIRRRQTGDLFNAVNDLGQNARTLSVYDPRSRLLDLLGVRYFVADGAPTFPSIVGGGRSITRSDGLAVVPVRTPLTTAAVEILSSLGDAATVPDGEPVAAMTLVAVDGQTWTFPIVAGVDSAEWLYDAAGAAGAVRHRMAPVARTTGRPGGGRAYLYRARFDLAPLGLPALREIRLEVQHPTARWHVETVLLHTPFSARFRLAHAEGDLRIWENLDARPRAWWVGAYAVEADPSAALRQVGDGTVDTARVALLSAPVPGLSASQAPPAAGAVAPGNSAGGGVARLSRASANTRHFEVDAPGDGLLMIAETFGPGWQAAVDGRPATLHPADGAFAAVVVPAGRHDVDLRYLPRSVVLGAAISSLVAGCLVVAALTSRLRRRAAGQPPGGAPPLGRGQYGEGGAQPGQPPGDPGQAFSGKPPGAHVRPQAWGSTR